MPTTEAVFEDGVLKPLLLQGFKEHQRYQLNWQEVEISRASVDTAAVPARLAHRVDVLPDGRRVIRFEGALTARAEEWPEDFDPVGTALTELRQEQARLRAAAWAEAYPLEPEP